MGRNATQSRRRWLEKGQLTRTAANTLCRCNLENVGVCWLLSFIAERSPTPLIALTPHFSELTPPTPIERCQCAVFAGIDSKCCLIPNGVRDCRKADAWSSKVNDEATREFRNQLHRCHTLGFVIFGPQSAIASIRSGCPYSQ